MDDRNGLLKRLEGAEVHVRARAPRRRRHQADRARSGHLVPQLEVVQVGRKLAVLDGGFLRSPVRCSLARESEGAYSQDTEEKRPRSWGGPPHRVVGNESATRPNL